MRFQQFPQLKVMHSTGSLSAFSQEGNKFIICCNTVGYLLDCLLVIHFDHLYSSIHQLFSILEMWYPIQCCWSINLLLRGRKWSTLNFPWFWHRQHVFTTCTNGTVFTCTLNTFQILVYAVNLHEFYCLAIQNQVISMQTTHRTCVQSYV